VTIPRDRFNTENRERIGRILLDAFSGTQLDFTLQFSESLLVRVNYIVHGRRTPPRTARFGEDRGATRAGHARLDRGTCGRR